MKNIALELLRDLKRLIKAPSALIVLIALLILPSAYTWYNVAVFWDPYGATGNIQVSVVIEDEGATIEGTQLNVGEKIEDVLHQNNKLKWAIEDKESAMDHLYAGESYAVFYVPSDFTSNLLTIASGDIKQPTITYYVNEKASAVSPKVTDMGKTVLENQINSTFVSTVTDVAVEAINAVIPELDPSGVDASILSKLDEMQTVLNKAGETVNKLDEKLADVQSKRDAAQAALDLASASLATASTDLAQVSSDAAAVESAIETITPEISQAVLDCIEALTELEPIAKAQGHEEAFNLAMTGLKGCQSAIFEQMLPTAATGLGELSSSASSLGAVTKSTSAVVEQAKTLLEEVDSAITTSRTALQQTQKLINDVSSDLSTVSSDISAMSLSTVLSNISTSLNASTIAKFVSSPTTVRTEKLYDMGSYGTGMAPIFMNLTSWIGAFMLILVFKTTMDSENVSGLTHRQHYVGRFLFFCIPALLQAIICCIGLLVLGVSPVVPAALFVADMVCSFCFLSILYALAMSLGHLGMGLGVVLVILQLPAATGIYPIEMLEQFYQNICALFPFTYGIAAMREALFGFYGNTFVDALLILVLLGAGFFFAGFALNPITANTRHAIREELGKTGLINGSDDENSSDTISKGKLLRRLSSGDEYRQELASELANFDQRYPRWIRRTLTIVIIASVLVGVFCLACGADRSIMITFWLVCYLGSILFVGAVVSLRRQLRQLLALGDMSDSEVMRVYKTRTVPAGPTATSPVEADGAAEDDNAPEPDDAPEPDNAPEPDDVLETEDASEAENAPEACCGTPEADAEPEGAPEACNTPESDNPEGGECHA